jgi:hypothetical protein
MTSKARNLADVISGNFDIPSSALDNAIPADGSITPSKLDRAYVNKAGDSMTGALAVGGSGTPATTLDVKTTGANVLTSVLTTGISDLNFRLGAMNGVAGGTNTSMAKLGLFYLGVGESSTIDFIRGGGATDGAIGFRTNGIERMRMRTDGTLLNSSGSPMLRQTGAVLQVVHVDFATYQAFTVPANVNQSQATGLTATITPSSANSRILAICSVNLGHGGSSTVVRSLLQRTGPATANSVLSVSAENTAWSTVIYTPTPQIMYANESLSWLDSPGSTAACTYTLQIGGNTAGSVVYINGASGYAPTWGGTSHLTLLEIAA